MKKYKQIKYKVYNQREGIKRSNVIHFNTMVKINQQLELKIINCKIHTIGGCSCFEIQRSGDTTNY